MPAVTVTHPTLTVDTHPRTLTRVDATEGATPTRLLLAVHGSGQTGRRFRRATGGALDAWAEQGRGVVVYPDSWRGGLWNDARVSTRSKAREEGVDDLAFLRALVAQARAEGVRQVVGLGYSNGGQLLLRALLEAPDLLDAVVLVGATVPAADNLLVDPTGASGAVPLVLVHGTADRIVPFEGGMASIFGFRPRGLMRSFDDSLAFWRERAGLTGEPGVRTLPHRSRSRTEVRELAWREEGRAPVVGYRVEGGGHVVPNRRRAGSRILGRTTPDLDVETVLDRVAEGLPEEPATA